MNKYKQSGIGKAKTSGLNGLEVSKITGSICGDIDVGNSR